MLKNLVQKIFKLDGSIKRPKQWIKPALLLLSFGLFFLGTISTPHSEHYSLRYDDELNLPSLAFDSDPTNELENTSSNGSEQEIVFNSTKVRFEVPNAWSLNTNTNRYFQNLSTHIPRCNSPPLSRA